MNTLNTKISIGLACLVLVVVSCRKTTPSNTTTVAPNIYDTVQNRFTISALNNPEPGQIFISPYLPGDSGSGVVMVLNQNGHVIKQIKTPGETINFQKWVINGKTRYTYEVQDPSDPLYTGGTVPGYEIIADSNFNEIKRVQLYDNGNISTSVLKGLDGHDFILIDDNHYILETFYPETVTNIPDSLNPVKSGVKVIAPVIQEVINDVVVWQWDGTNYPEFYGSSVEGNTFTDSSTYQDYMHLNAMYIDPRDNNLLLSFRNLNQVVKINRTNGNIIWRLGGKNSDFPLNSDQVFLRQHNITLTDDNSTFLLFDDGEQTIRPSSRVLEFNLDEIAKQVLTFRSFDIPEPFCAYMGSVQKRGNTYFIGGGWANYVLEVNYLTGEKLLELKAPVDKFYRAYKY